ncbi:MULTISPECIES: restriction endonuclease subunit S [Aeromonas]|uniref:Type I restriction modification DNA specificity domain-containing protein n=1 Tax=Aeromonas veronii AMC34 TaxID=1073383 RepID=K1IRZ5_AERVE|nr:MULTISPECIES: restriction endonuclease subunit S [Aeromonas]EKB18687.1 hypothetical protein HMPREF1168_02461 [Aeromonas veronii AMC34]BBU05224.1 hypothetical protein WP9W18E04_25630 [Aeromonas veronii]
MVPKGWLSTTIDDAKIKVIDGDRGKEYPKSTDFLEAGYCLFLSAKNVTKSGFLFDELQFINKDKDQKLRKGRVERGNIVLTTRGSVGQFAYFDDSVPYDVMRINSGMVVIDSSQSELSARFLYALCRSSIVAKQIDAASFGSAQPQLTVGIIKGIKLPVPPLPEQKKIAKILSTWDKAISTTEQLLANSQQQKKALMQQLLTGKKRLLDNNGIKPRVSKTPYATLPCDWGEIAMEEVSSFITKGATPTTYGFDWQDTGIPFLRSECVGEDGFKESGLAFICDEAHEAMKRSKVFTGDLLITITGNVGRVCKLPDHICEANINQHIAKITLNAQQVNTDFIYHCLRDIKYRNYFERITTGQAYPQISLVQVRDIVIPLPSREEQQKIANVLSIADKEITALQQKLDALKQEKKALMQQLLTGKRRVKVEVAA